MSQEKATTQGMNRAKLYQLILFPMNNGQRMYITF